MSRPLQCGVCRHGLPAPLPDALWPVIHKLLTLLAEVVDYCAEAMPLIAACVLKDGHGFGTAPSNLVPAVQALLDTVAASADTLAVSWL